MTQANNTPPPPAKGRPLMGRRLFGLGLGGAALGITAGLVAINGGFNAPGAAAGECVANAATSAAIDEAAKGQLAALIPANTARNYDHLDFNDPSGSQTSMSALRGDVLLVNFWASWCGPCRREMPALSALQARYGGRGFEIITINLDVGDDGLEKGRAFLRDDMKIDNLPLFADPTMESFNVLKTMGVALGLPATLLLDRNGCELAVLAGPAEWDTPDGHGVIEVAMAL
ncbi:MAG: TlpA family protein disulfide reductase [Alphaproteobacteria bacterium]|nr:TlpA family protein disulfide reductase [Alphaproteobacteria bacterium]